MDREQLVESLLTSIPLIHKRLMKGFPNFGISKQQLKLLVHINQEDGKPMNYYSERMMIPKSNLTVIADKLIEEGLIGRELDPDDRRIIILKITGKGRKRLLECKEIVKREMLKKLEALNDKDIQTLNKLIEEIMDIFKKTDTND